MQWKLGTRTLATAIGIAKGFAIREGGLVTVAYKFISISLPSIIFSVVCGYPN